MSQPRIISVGSINIDVQVRSDKWPQPGSSALATDCLLVGGGKAANVAYLARRLGAAAELIGRVGGDPLVDRILDPLRAIGVDLTAVGQSPELLSGVAMIVTASDGKKSILLAPNANRAWPPGAEEGVAERIRGAPQGSVVVVDLEISTAVAIHTLAAARAAGLAVVLDPAPAPEVSSRALAEADYVTPDASEAEQLTGIAVHDAPSAFAAADQLRKRGVANALVKLSDGGCVVVADEVRAQLVPQAVQPQDTTGAGDAFAAALAVAVLERQPLLEAARWAVAASQIAVTRYGSQASYPDRAELEASAKHVAVHT